MAYSDPAAVVILNALKAYGVWCSLHTASPGSTGINEISGITRLSTTWGTPAGRSLTGSGVLLTIPSGAGLTVTHFSVWTLQTGGQFVAGDIVNVSEVYSTAGGTYALIPVLAVS